jgi:hypothetical protein
MSKDLKNIAVRVLAIGAAACSSVYAARPAPQPQPKPIQVVGPPAPSPYEIDLIGDSGQALDTFQKDNRFYVLGMAGTRYSIRVTNPTDRRVEAVVSVDGLDVIDGLDADFTGKRGYIVPPHDVLVVDGFRTSQSQVAAFRFSSVANSYAERKGKGRNVGVVGVAIFEEKGDPVIVVPEVATARPSDPVDRWLDHDHDYGGAGYGGVKTDSIRGRDSANRGRYAPSAGDDGGDYAEAEASAKASAPAEDRVGGGAPSRPAPRRQHFDLDTDKRMTQDETCCRPTTTRPGLGTQWGEQRYSSVTFTRFQRKNPTVPDALAELRYNDSDGLAALGILVKPAYDPNEVAKRETADPFPATRFATPPTR